VLNNNSKSPILIFILMSVIPETVTGAIAAAAALARCRRVTLHRRENPAASGAMNQVDLDLRQIDTRLANRPAEG